MHQVLLASLPLAQGQVVHIGESTLDPMGVLFLGPEYPFRMPLEGTEPYVNMEIPIGIRLPPVPTRLPASRQCTMCYNPGCLVICGTVTMEALEVATRLSSARFHQQRAANTGKEPLAPTPRQQQSFLCEYNCAYATAMGPHYLTTSRSAAVAKDIGMPPTTFHQLMAAERRTYGTVLPSHSRDQQPT